MAFCSNCGAQLITGMAFCSSCGKPVSMQPQSAVQQAGSEPPQGSGQPPQQGFSYQPQPAITYGETPGQSQGAESSWTPETPAAQQQSPYTQAPDTSAQPQQASYGQTPQTPFGQQQTSYGQAQDTPSAQPQQASYGQTPYAQAPETPYGQTPFGQQQTPDGAAYAPYGQPYPAAQPQKKSKKGLIIGLVIGGLVLAAGITVLILFLTGILGGGKMEGYYKLTSMQTEGVSLGEDFLTAQGYDCALVLEEGGTGWLATYEQREVLEVLELTWTESAITVDGETLPVTRDRKTLTMNAPDEPGTTLVFEKSDDPAPEKPEVPVRINYEDIEGSYYYVMRDGEYYLDDEFSYLFIYSDGTGYIGVDELGSFYDEPLVTYDGRNISFEVNGEIWSGTLTDGVMELNINGSTYVFANYTADLYDEWIEVYYSQVPEDPGVEVAGYYVLTYMELGDDAYGDDYFDNMKEQGMHQYIVLEENGEGWMMLFENLEEFSWDEDTVYFSNTWDTYECSGDTFWLYSGDDTFPETYMFERSTGIIPEKPVVVSATGTVTLINNMDFTVDEIYMIASADAGFDEPFTEGKLQPGESMEMDLTKTNGVYPGRFNMALYQEETDLAFFVYYLPLYDGDIVSFEMVDGDYCFVYQSADGDQVTYIAIVR